MNKISVCVPTYNRPETLRQLIHSYLRQDTLHKELIISDDTPNDSIKKLVESFHDASIQYFHNPKSLRFADNLRASLKRASGEFLFILGDDDLLLSDRTLSTYVNIFQKHPSVGFIYCNSVQFSNNLQIEYIIRHFSKNVLFRKGESAMRGVWTRSIFIGGIGLRNSKQLLADFPVKKVLHPQVEFIGNIINKADAYGIADHLIGMRSHEDQIIFRALRDKEIRQEGDHVTVELHDMFERLKKKYNLTLESDFLADQLLNEYVIMLFKEKHVLGSQAMEENYRRFRTLYPEKNNSRKLRTAHFVAKTTPASVIPLLRSVAIKAHLRKNRADVSKFQNLFNEMVKNHE